ncbi:MAG: FHA domain-containing protein, partial [Acidobacteria bacterium]
MAFFIHRSDGTQAQLVQVAGTRLRIGRGTNAELRFDDAAVDLEHAVIEQQATGGYAVSDRGSVTGTYLNGERLSAPARLRQDDEVDVGPFRLRVQHADPEDPLFLHVARIEQAEEADATFISQLLAERSGTLPVDEGSIYGTIRVASDDLLAMAEAKRRQLEGSAAPPSPSPSP